MKKGALHLTGCTSWQHCTRTYSGMHPLMHGNSPGRKTAIERFMWTAHAKKPAA